MEYATRVNMKDMEIYEKAVKRAKVNGVDVMNYTDTVIFLEKEIDMYRDKIAKLLEEKEDMKTCLAVRKTTASEIIKALADNGYTNISVNFYKDIEKERENDDKM